VATPLLNVPVPSVVEPSLKVTVPVGWVDELGTSATVAVKVTELPTAIVEDEALRTVVVASLSEPSAPAP
jgi:hypothetical protein